MHDIYTEITQRIVTALEAGTPPWVRPWSGEADPTAHERRDPAAVPRRQLPDADDRGAGPRLSAQRWLTYRQAAALGGQVRKGEHGTPVVFWKLRESRCRRRSRASSRCCAATPCSTSPRSTACRRAGGAAAQRADWPSDESAEALIEALRR